MNKTNNKAIYSTPALKEVELNNESGLCLASDYGFGNSEEPGKGSGSEWNPFTF